MVMRKRKADEVVNLSADVEEWIKTELWEERVKLVEEVVKVVKVEKEEEEMEEGPITKMPPEILNVIFSILPHKCVILKASVNNKTNNFFSPQGSLHCNGSLLLVELYWGQALHVEEVQGAWKSEFLQFRNMFGSRQEDFFVVIWQK